MFPSLFYKMFYLELYNRFHIDLCNSIPSNIDRDWSGLFITSAFLRIFPVGKGFGTSWEACHPINYDEHA